MLALTVWLVVFGVAFVVQAVYGVFLWRGWTQARRTVVPATEHPLPPISVIVAARDEAVHLPALLAALVQQTHPCYEVILVDDASVDATPEIIRTWQQALSSLRLLRLDQPEAPRKKHALTQGIAAATYDLLAFTDADCAPPPGWLEALARHHAAAAEDVLLVGYSPLRSAPGFVNHIARYETLMTGFLTAAAVGLGRPYMAVGRNLSYPRSVFQRVDGFKHSLHMMSGDDDLFVQEVRRRRAAAVRHVFNLPTIVPSESPATWSAWLRQKRRHVSAGRSYARDIQRHLTLFHATGVILWAAPLALGWIGVGLLAARLLAQAAVLHRVARVFHERQVLSLQPVLALLYTLYTLFVAPFGLVKMPKRW